MSDDGLIIVGASLAGAKAAEGARTQGWEGPIRLVGAEAHVPYERPPLSKGVLIGTDQPATALVHDEGFYVDGEIDLLLGVAATRIDLAERTVELHGQRRLRFSQLILATGSSPRRLGVAGAELPEVIYLRTLDDSLALRDRLLPGRRLAVIGASWIGTEVAACARRRDCAVVMIDPLSTPLERVLGPEVGRYFAALHRGHGVDLRLGTGVDAIVGTDHVEGVRLSDGTTIDADVVVIGVGVTPNIELAREAGLEVAGGVVVDRTLRTGHPAVHAAGDITEAEHPLLRAEGEGRALGQRPQPGAHGGSELRRREPRSTTASRISSLTSTTWEWSIPAGRSPGIRSLSGATSTRAPSSPSTFSMAGSSAAPM